VSWIRTAAIAIAISSLAVASAWAQESEFFGGAEGTMTIPAAAFLGLPPPDGDGFSNFNYPGIPAFAAGQVMLSLPNGSAITQLCVVGYDGSTFGTVNLFLTGWEYPRIGTTTPTPARTLATAASPISGTPGLSTYCASLPAPIVVKSFADLDGNGVSGWTGYRLQGSLVYGPNGGAQPLLSQLAFGSVVVVWRRTVSPAPAVARFTDVPTTHPQFRWVEAIAASGITGGCTADRFCPDTALTRGNMAQFLAVALGLHFPN
jgi:hypothetical protein